MSVGNRGQGSRGPSWIFIYDTDKLERGGLMVLFFGFVFFVGSPRKFFYRRPCPKTIFASYGYDQVRRFIEFVC